MSTKKNIWKAEFCLRMYPVGTGPVWDTATFTETTFVRAVAKARRIARDTRPRVNVKSLVPVGRITN